MRFALAAPFGDHPALAELVLQRAAEADPARAYATTGLLLLAHGSPDPAANQPTERLVQRIRATTDYATVGLSFLGLNAPLIGDAIDDFSRQGISTLIVMPYFLQYGDHVAEDIPAALAAAHANHPALQIVLARYLGYDPQLVAVIADRAAQAVED